MLNMLRHDGPEGSIPLVIAHGLFGSARNWNVIARRLSRDRTVIAVDMRNHGESPHFDSNAYQDMADDLAEVMAPLGEVDLLGHSMGGKAAMTLALTRPEHLRRLIVADIAPVTYPHSQTDKIEAMEAVDLASVTRRSDAQEQLARHGIEPALQAFFTQSLDLADRRWRYNLPVLRRDMEKIIGFPQIEGRHQGRTLFLTGAESDYVQPGHRDTIKQLFPRAVFAKLPGAGHWLHADKPREFEAAVTAFLSAGE
ncbi:hydrolase, alpha/beta fold family protein [Pseudooceanicola batsensis HTCC2597]|uniref:Hydrolase, alpha/beta fold family protein n=1 Tax=Pseudooceanicola batsensis (strain ATCC BAA-863 / DSM 15984 / KCTC 12145 / HTCC2597) TaxID=252305 RepID=A3TTB3_PSEBH|nr:alpha/beta fold hydrolase [Pseudooceanicola batsensis]EAQ04890.1 hydrolase, alpha/beta fold family protein [Pseudooceanicola batsensis HTCC2597]